MESNSKMDERRDEQTIRQNKDTNEMISEGNHPYESIWVPRFETFV